MRTRRRFTPEFKAKFVLDVLTGTPSPAEACRKHAPSPNLLGLRKRAFLERAPTLFPPDDQRDEGQARIAELKQPLGRATRQIEIGNKTSRLLDAASRAGRRDRQQDRRRMLLAGQGVGRAVSALAGGVVSPVRDLGLIQRLVDLVRLAWRPGRTLLICVDGLASYATAFW